jgi:hypothetical protein
MLDVFNDQRVHAAARREQSFEKKTVIVEGWLFEE